MRVLGEHRDVGDHDAGLRQQAQLERELHAPGERGSERGPTEELGDDHRHELRLAARESPEVFDDRLDPAVLRRQHLEVGPDVRQLAEPRAQARVRALARRMDRVEAIARDPARVPARLVQRSRRTTST